MQNDIEAHFIEKYLARIAFEGTPVADMRTLVQIQQKHIASIPFENLNPLLGIPVLLDDDSLFKKMVLNKRGGYCFENNLLLKRILQLIGFDVRGLMGRAGPAENSVGRTHLILLVSLGDDQYIVDCGYGGFVPTYPLLLRNDLIQHTPNEEFRIVQHAEDLRLEIFVDGEWKRLYEFDLRHHIIADYEVANWYTSTCPGSRFTHQLIVARAEGNRRFTLTDLTYSEYNHGKRIKRTKLDNYTDIQHLLERNFLIDLSGLTGLQELVEHKLKSEIS
ncbi:MAG: arylamine N-acetyltransferase [Saprospiraceae bacterium]|nr:arylamine N-acetyltransferase [Saprospiraceae bacterium]